MDYSNRTSMAKLNMFENSPAETQYFYSDPYGSGAQLDGSHSYEVTFAKGQKQGHPLW
jgi:hypothetical protein